MTRLLAAPLLGGVLLAGACGSETAPRRGRGGAGDSATDSAAPPVDSGGPRRPGFEDPIETGDLACYLGPEGLGDTCVAVVAWDPAWGPDYAYPEPLDAQYAAPTAFLDLEEGSAVPNLEVAPNFVLSEFASARKGRFAVLQPHLVERLQAVRDGIGSPVLVNSGYRSPGYNAGIDGAAEWSRHLYGDAVDIASPESSLDALADQCEDEGASYVAVYTSHVHCDWRDHPLDPAFFADGTTARSDSRPPAVEVQQDGGHIILVRVSGFPEGTPLARWWAWDETGMLLASSTGTSWTLPVGTSRYAVDVGRQVFLTNDAPPRHREADPAR